MRSWPSSGWSPSASGAMPWKASRDGPPQTTTSPWARRTRVGRSARRRPEQEDRGQPQRHRHDGRAQVLLVAVLVQRQARTRQIAVDQAGIGNEAVIAGGGGGLGGKRGERCRHRWPRLPRGGIDRVIAIAAPVRYPAVCAAVGHGHRHAQSAGRDQVSPWRCRRDPVYGVQQCQLYRRGEASQQHCAGSERLAGLTVGMVGVGGKRVKEIESHLD